MVSSDWTEISFRVQWQKLAWLQDLQVEQSRKTVIVIRWFLYGRAIAQRIKGTPGITGWWFPRAHIDGIVWHLDVGSSHPGAGEGPKGSAVRRLKWYVSWVQNVVRQFGPYLPQVFGKLRGVDSSTRGPSWIYQWCSSCSARSIAG